MENLQPVRRVPSLTPAEAEQFWATGENARPVSADPTPEPETLQEETPKLQPGPQLPGDEFHAHLDQCRQCREEVFNLCSVGAALLHSCADSPIGVGVPGVGVVYADGQISQGSPTRSGRPSVDGEVPLPVRDLAGGGVTLNEERERLFIELMFAARILAQAQIEPADGPSAAFCTECVCDADVTVQHDRICRTGRVLRILDKLVATVEKPVQRGAGLAVAEHFCLQCGVSSGDWVAEQRPEAEPDLSRLGLNQCVGTGVDGKGHTVLTHQCWLSEGKIAGQGGAQ